MTDSQTIKPLYSPTKQAFLQLEKTLYANLHESVVNESPVECISISPRSAKAWQVKAGQICRIVADKGPQVVDVNFWNLHNPRERFWASRTRQLYGAHINTYDQLWSVLPYLRPMLTVTHDTINYGLDSDGAGCHDLLGTRCDPYIHQMLTEEALDTCCHSNLTRAVLPYHLDERDVHDVINIFQVTGLTKETEQYFVKPCPAQAGDYWEFFAEQDLLCAASACPHGDMSLPIWGDSAVDTADICRSIEIQIFNPDRTLLKSWREPEPAGYAGIHGLQASTEK
jgi:uncharacterized protein YcgI (DUF1989 family)